MSVRLRLTLSILLLFGISFAVLMRSSLKEMRPRYLEAMEESTVDTALILASSVRYNEKVDRLDIFPLAQAVERAKESPIAATIFSTVKTELGIRVLVFDKRRRVIYDSQNGEALGKDYSMWNDVIRAFRGEYGARSTHDDPVVPGSSVKYVTLPIRMAGGQIVGALTVGKPSRSVVPLLASARKRAIGFGVALGVVALIMGIILSLWITRPIEQLTRYAANVRDGKKAKLPKLGPVELQIMGATLEQMRTALEGKKYVEEYTHTLTHELKSPLSAIQGAAEILAENPPEPERKQFIENIRTETARITDLVNRMLLMASIDSRHSRTGFEPLSLKDLVDEVVNTFIPVLTKKRIKVNVGSDNIVVRGDAFLIRHALSNLIQNAIDFSPENGKLEITLSLRDGFAVFRVEDEGPGFPAYAQEKLFDRFYSLPRPDTQKRSSGLGLSLVKEVAVLHNGDASIENIPTRGAQATLRLPV